MSTDEIEYYTEYCNNIDSISQALSQEGGFCALDLTVDMQPPKDLYVQVRITKDFGLVTLPESGEVNLKKNTNIFLRRTDVDHLAKRGMLTEVWNYQNRKQ